MAAENPARLVLRDLFGECEPSALEQRHRELLGRWEATRATPTKGVSRKLGRFADAVALFAFGHLEAAEDVMGYYTPRAPDGTRMNAAVLIRVLRDLLPLPAHLDPENPAHHADIRCWIGLHASRLRWDERAGVFALTQAGE